MSNEYESRNEDRKAWFSFGGLVAIGVLSLASASGLNYGLRELGVDTTNAPYLVEAGGMAIAWSIAIKKAFGKNVAKWVKDAPGITLRDKSMEDRWLR